MNKLTDSLIAMTSNKLQESIREIPAELLETPIDELEKIVKPTKKLKALKKKFHDELAYCTDKNLQLSMAGVCRGAMHVNNFQRNVMTKPEVMAWLVIPDIESQLELKVLGDKALNKLEQILDLPVAKNAKTILAAAKLILDRTDPVVNKVESKEMKLTADLTPQTEEEKMKKLEDLKRKMINVTRQIEPINNDDRSDD